MRLIIEVELDDERQSDTVLHGQLTEFARYDIPAILDGYGTVVDIVIFQED